MGGRSVNFVKGRANDASWDGRRGASGVFHNQSLELGKCNVELACSFSLQQGVGKRSLIHIIHGIISLERGFTGDAIKSSGIQEINLEVSPNRHLEH